MVPFRSCAHLCCTFDASAAALKLEQMAGNACMHQSTRHLVQRAQTGLASNRCSVPQPVPCRQQPKDRPLRLGTPKGCVCCCRGAI